MSGRLSRLIGTLLLMAVVSPAAAAPGTGAFLMGGDVSLLPSLESAGIVYRDDAGPADLLQIMARHGCNTFRVRLFVDPDGRGAVVQDLAYVIGLGRRIKQAGAVLLLDIHYSDTWADPGHQDTPEAWRGLSLPRLGARVEAYTADVMERMKVAGCLPDIVQLGNEVTAGFLGPRDGSREATRDGMPSVPSCGQPRAA